MIERLIESLSFVRFLVFATFFHALLGLAWKNKMHRYILIILTVFSTTELISICQSVFILEFKLGVIVATIIHSIMWLLILREVVSFPKVVSGLTIAFATFSICDVLFIEGWKIFNIYSFILGALLYLVLFLIESFYQLKKENFYFFFNNHYLLLTSPVLFFIGLSFMFGFRSKAINNTIFFDRFELYDTIIFSVNIVYYSLVNLYIYREKRKLYEF